MIAVIVMTTIILVVFSIIMESGKPNLRDIIACLILLLIGANFMLISLTN